MKTMSVAELKSQFSTVIGDLREGREVAITYGRNKELLATIVPQSKMPQPNYSIKVGDLESAGWEYKVNDFEMSDEQLLGA
jgi:antitoxin (DNA-binding transcriptional repressor) of toxin-antitoxin stability system